MRLPVLIVEASSDRPQRMLKDRRDHLENMRPVLEHIARILREDAGREFATASNNQWQPLKPATVMAKMEKGLPPLTPKGRIPKRLMQNGSFGPTNILIATGALRDSYRKKGARGHVERIDAKAGTVYVGSRLRTPDGRYCLAMIHQYGTSPYMIFPRRARFLSYINEDGERVFRRHVRHPGLVPRPVRLSSDAKKTVKELVVRWAGGEKVSPSS